ncbi:MAG TPA: HNH endonuclease signature motif containing protein, partial [Polyangiaceae bacterium]|nr:HNH endonuclease signature motif containing protein [Polyangiaceae bacterium]
GMIERGEIHLTALLLLREHLTEDNHDDLLRAASGKTKGQVQELLATRFPRPDVPSLIQVMPEASASLPAAAAPAPKTACVEPLSPERYRVQFTATAELKEKIERAANLMRHTNPSGDLSVIVKRAIDLLIAELEKQRLGKTKHPAKGSPRKSTRPGYVTRAVRREVFERDGEQCTFIDKAGRRCESRAFLELDHGNPRALGGTDDATNLSIRCRRHNALAAERDFGREYIEKKKTDKKNHPRQRGYESVLRGLTAMGFKEQQARRALGIIEERWEGLEPPLETVLRETLSILT